MGDARETVGAAVVRLLRDHGVDTVFGIPGVHTLELFRGIADTGVRHVLNRSELGAVFAADGYARTSGRPGVALLISGPGLTTAATAIAQAHHDSIPLLVVSAVVPRSVLGRGWGALHDLPDQQAFMSTLSARSTHVDDPSALPDALAAAFELFGSARPRPVHIQLPADVLRAPAPPLAASAVTAAPPQAPRDDLRRAARLLESADKPIILLGGGAVDAGQPARQLAQRLDAPVVMTLNAKGTVGDDHPWSLGTSLPCEGTRTALEQAGCVVAVGTELSEVDFYYGSEPARLGERLVRVDIDPDQLGKRYPATAALHGDAAMTLAALATTVAQRSPGSPESRIDPIRARNRWWDRARPLLPLVEEIAGALPHEALVAVDSTQLGYIGQNAWPAFRERSWMIPAGWGTLGPALPMAIGAVVAAPGRPGICVVGDGGLLYSIGEMATAHTLELPLTMLLWNNQGYEEMRDELTLAGIPHIGTDAAAHDYLELAHGFGWDAHRPATLAAVGPALEAALAAGRPTLLELTPALLA